MRILMKLILIFLNINVSGDKMPNEVEANHKDQNKEKEKKHDSGAADLEKVTDFAEVKEVGSSSAAVDAIAVISKSFECLNNIFWFTFG